MYVRADTASIGFAVSWLHMRVRQESEKGANARTAQSRRVKRVVSKGLYIAAVSS